MMVFIIKYNNLENPRIIKYGNFIIRLKDYELLKNDWLNDNLIDFYCNYYHGLLNPEEKEKIYVFSCHFYNIFISSKVFFLFDKLINRKN